MEHGSSFIRCLRLYLYYPLSQPVGTVNYELISLINKKLYLIFLQTLFIDQSESGEKLTFTYRIHVRTTNPSDLGAIQWLGAEPYVKIANNLY